MNVIWWFGSIWLWNASTLNHQKKEKKIKREFGQKEKTMKRISCCVIGVFGSPIMYTCVRHEKQVNDWIRREWWWKSGRQGGKNGRKRGEKKGKKWFGKSPFCFLFDCVFASSLFSPASTTPLHTYTHSLTTYTPYNKTHWCTSSHANGPCAVLPFFGSGQQDTLHHPLPSLHHLTTRNTH